MRFKLRISFKWKERLRDWEPYIYLAVVVLLTLSLVVIGGYLIRQNHEIKANAKAAARTAALAAATAKATQANRVEVIRRDCEEQNNRHHRAVGALYALLRKSGVKPARRTAAARPIINLISALAPQQDCDKVVAAATPKPVKAHKT